MIYISVASGSSGNCHYFQKDDSSVLVDAGLSCKKTVDLLKKHDVDLKNLKAVFITHEHADHIKGAGIISRKFDIPIYATKGTWDAMQGKIGSIKDENIKIIESRKQIAIGDLLVEAVDINHDANEPVAYRVDDGKKMVSIITDLGVTTNETFNFARKSDLLVIEANHDLNMLEAGPYSYDLKRRVRSRFGHLSNDCCGKFCVDIIKEHTDKVMLAHLSRQNNMPVLAYQSVVSILNENGIKVGQDVDLSVLEQFNTSEKVKL